MPVHTDQQGPVAVLTLNRPDKRNAFDGALTALARRIFIIPHHSTFVKRKIAQKFYLKKIPILCNLTIDFCGRVWYNVFTR